jgi:hypothetical protein
MPPFRPSKEEIKSYPTVPRDWFFTFGQDHGYSNCYIIINGTISESRDQMQSLFGSKWAFQYPSKIAAGVERFSLREIKLNDIPHLRNKEKQNGHTN